nr:SIP domain-containing protein [Psychrobacter sp. PraFG1]UNK04570.1 siderophore-interacting protein [Psychrobacter sp. PraFG1]
MTVLPVMNADLAQGAPLAELIAHTLTQHLKSNPIHIQKVWGALETSTSKALRALLKPTLNLDRSAMIVKGYWRQD